MELNEKLKQLRKQKNITQEELADRLYVSRTAISKWESGRGYPSIDSLKAISRFFSVSIDDLLSGDELILIAENETLEKANHLHSLIFGILDCMMALLFFLPLLNQPGDGKVYAVSLLSLTEIQTYTQVMYITIVAAAILFGIAELALQNISNQIWLSYNRKTSLTLTIIGLLIFIVTQQPYAALFLFCILILKGILLIKH